MKTLLAAACIISIALGFIIGKSTSAPEQTTLESPTKPTRHERSNSPVHRTRTSDTSLLDSILNGRPINEIPPADLAALIASLSKYDPDMDALTLSKKSYQLQLLLTKISASDLATLATTIASDPEAKKSEALRSILSALAENNPDRAFAWLSTQEKNGGLYSIVIGAIAKNDPTAAADLLQNAILDGTFSNHEHWTATYSVGQSMAKLGSESFMNFIDSLPQQQQGNILYNAIQHVPESEHIKLLADLHQRKLNGDLENVSMEYLFSKVLSTNESKAKEWFSKLPDGDEKNSLRTSAASNYFQAGDKEAAASWMRDALTNSPGKEKQMLENIINTLAYNNPEAIPFFTQLLPEGIEYTAKDMEHYAMNSLYNGSGGLTAIASAIRDPNEQALLIANTLEKITSSETGNRSRLNATDYEILSRKIATIGFTGEYATLVNKALQSAKKTTPTINK
jgi:hypothetical protein